jgi:hypothetical protein
MSAVKLKLDPLGCVFRPTAEAVRRSAYEQETVMTELTGMKELTGAELDAVAAGALLNVLLVDVVDVKDVNVAVPVNAAVAATVLGGGAAAGALQLPGRQR